MKIINLMSVRELRGTLRKAIELLALARCPDPDCDGQGFSVVPDGDGEATQQQCQWCDEKSQLAEDE